MEDKDYTLDELESMSIVELCEIAVFLGIIREKYLIEEIYDMRGKEPA